MTDLLSPEASKFPPLVHTFSNGKKYCIGFFPVAAPGYPDIVYMALTRLDDTGWTMVHKRDDLWDDIKQVAPDEASYMRSSLAAFNEVIAKEPGMTPDVDDVNQDGEVSYAEKLARFLADNVRVVADRFVFVP